MKAQDLTKQVSTESLLKQFESKFGQTLNLRGMSKEALEDMANMVRTKIHTITDNQHFGQELKDGNYHKHQMMLDVINQAIKEAPMSNLANLNDPNTQQLIKKVQQATNLNDKDKKQMIGSIVTKEGVEHQSELILAAKDMMDKVTSFLGDLADMKTESMLELADKIRDEMGADKADAFIQKVKPAIESAEQTLSSSRTELDQAVRILTGEQTTSTPVGAPDQTASDANIDADLDTLNTPDAADSDEFAATDANAGGTEPAGRAQRESREVFEASNRIYTKLSGK
jgi:hypothetical protein